MIKLPLIRPVAADTPAHRAAAARPGAHREAMQAIWARLQAMGDLAWQWDEAAAEIRTMSIRISASVDGAHLSCEWAHEDRNLAGLAIAVARQHHSLLGT